MDEPILRDGYRVVAEFPGRVTALEAVGDYLKVETVAGDFLVTQDGQVLHMAGGGRA